MKCWAYVFHFICIGSQRITVGKILFVADFQHEVVSIVKQRGFVCEYCGESPESSLVMGSVLEAPSGEIKATPDIIM